MLAPLCLHNNSFAVDSQVAIPSGRSIGNDDVEANPNPTFTNLDMRHLDRDDIAAGTAREI